MTYSELKRALKQGRKLKGFPLVDNPDHMVLLGSIKRSELIALIQKQVSRERRLEAAMQRRREAARRAREEEQRRREEEERRRDAEELRREVERRRAKERLEEERRRKKEAAAAADQGHNSIE